ncbi:MAG: leucyl aminopeptidase family protein [Bdellovibrionota bacterium]
MNMQSVLKSNFQFEMKPNIKLKTKPQGFVYILGAKSANQRKSELKKIVELHLSETPNSKPIDFEKKTVSFSGKNGPVWILQNFQINKGTHKGLLDESVYALFRDQSGLLVSQFKNQQIDNIEIIFNNCPEIIMRASLIGLEMASYNFLNSFNNTSTKKSIVSLITQNKSAKLDKAQIEKYQLEAKAVILARHLVNLPPNEINPESIEKIIKNELNFPKSLKIDIWDHKKLAAENMNLHLAVGKGSDTPPRMIHIKYRPQKKIAGKKAKKPIAFVGKGITFDTGGLDIKPSSGMRLMKKDMGGAAAVLALAYWAAHSNYSRSCDFYLALAENSVDAKSMRPSDLYRSRAGYLVEIDNTDAEGRLVLADVMDVAATKKGADEPEIIIDIATLTGAIKVALGTEVAGLFTNNDQLAEQIQVAGQSAGEPNWRMPLVQKYFSSMSSNFADFKNSAEGFGSAITASLFLEKFCHGKKWAHLDVYCWNDKPTGALSFAGGSGQPVQSMIELLKGI